MLMRKTTANYVQEYGRDMTYFITSQNYLDWLSKTIHFLSHSSRFF